ncbi:UNVERIFIED_CONTAM: hypothetical protein Slati_2140200 [Sesamum latifolium]|uniref:Uncharacterized protein n=1 Tax=Sesamum latifolium TaxID=2727402 RepID=A0AAW2WR43_9LAMI
MTNEMQKNYDRLYDVSSIMLHMKDVYTILDRNIRYATTKAFSGSSWLKDPLHKHGIKMFPIVEKLEDRQVGLGNDTYINVNLQALSPSFDPFFVKFNMNGLDKFIHELINMLVQQTGGCWKREKGKAKAATSAQSALIAPVALVSMGKAKRKVDRQPSRAMMSSCITEKRVIGRGSGGTFVIEVNMITKFAFWLLNTDCGAHIYNDLKVLKINKRLSNHEVTPKLGNENTVATEAIRLVN